jgi:hypothetical protein
MMTKNTSKMPLFEREVDKIVTDNSAVIAALNVRIEELEKELKETKNIIIAHQTADADGYIDDYGWVANWSEMQAGMLNLFEAHNLEQTRKGFWLGFEDARCHPDEMNILTQWEGTKTFNQVKALKAGN